METKKKCAILALAFVTSEFCSRRHWNSGLGAYANLCGAARPYAVAKIAWCPFAACNVAAAGAYGCFFRFLRLLSSALMFATSYILFFFFFYFKRMFALVDLYVCLS